MALNKKSSSSSSSSATAMRTFDVFLSFRGEDTRTGFTGHLYGALKQREIHTFMDDEKIEKGGIIGPELVKAIEESTIAVVILSTNYASSTWCLDELLKISEGHSKRVNSGQRQTVFPVFYHVDPSQVRNQTGAFGEAFAKHEQRYARNKVKKWREALTQLANIAGWDLKIGQSEHELINAIVKRILSILNRPSSKINNKNLIGMDSRIKKMISFLDLGKSNDVLTIGIWGMRGIGKTTLANEIHTQIRGHFESSYFLRNVRERFGNENDQDQLQKDLCERLLGYSCHDFTSSVEVHYNRLRYKKVLIILDDVDRLEQIEILVRNCDEKHHGLGPGSRIIVTTTDAHLLKRFGKNNIYEVDKLNEEQALKLFSMRAFAMDHPRDEYKDVSNEVVKYANGLPLALEVLGAFLYGRKIEAWSSTLEKLDEHPNDDIMRVLQVSFDGLEDTEKKMFLDIACFFKGEEKHRVIRILGNGNCSLIDIDVLVDKALVTVVGDKLWMHDLLQDLGRNIVDRESRQHPGLRSRLWREKDILKMLRDDKGTQAVEAIFLSLPETKQQDLNTDAFSKMCNMRLLRIYNVNFSGCIGYLSNELRLLEWHGYPSKYLPSSFQMDELVEINLSNSRIEQLWEESRLSERLKLINLSNCQYLTKTPNFNTTPNLENLILRGCKKLSAIHPSIGVLKRLVLLNLKGCESLKILAKEICLESLKTLILSGCSRLNKLPKIVGDMKELKQLYLDETAIVELPESIQCLTGLTLLNLKNCKNLRSLPNIVCSLTSLTTLNMSGCSCLDHLPENLGSLECLKELDASETAIREVASSITQLKSLQHLSFRGCSGMSHKSWPLILCSCLFEPENFGSVSLTLPSSFSGLLSLKSLDLSKCGLQDEAIPHDFWHISSLEQLHFSENNFRSLPHSMFELSKLRELSLNCCNKLQSLPIVPLSVKYVNARDCADLKYPKENIVWTTPTGFCLIECQKSNVDAERKEFNVPLSSEHYYLLLHSSREDDIFRGKGFESISSTTTIPNWCCSHSSTGSSVTIQLPPNSHHHNTLMGLALFILYEVKKQESINSTTPFVCHFSTNEDFLEISIGNFNVKEHSVGCYGVFKYIPQESFNGLLDKASFVKASVNLDSDYMSVNMCGAHIIYKQNVAKFVRDLYPAPNNVQDYVTHCQELVDDITKITPVCEVGSMIRDRTMIDMIDSVILKELKGSTSREPSNEVERGLTSRNRFLLHVHDSTSSIGKQGRESISSTKLGLKLQSMLSRLFQKNNAGNFDFGCIFPLKAILPWFTYQAVGRRIFCCLSPNLLKDKEWSGFALYVVYRNISCSSFDNLDLESEASLAAHLHIEPSGTLHTARFSLNKNCLTGFEHRLVVLYVPRVHFSQNLNLSIRIDVLFSISKHLEIEICGIRTVYDNDMKDFVQTIIECTIESPDVYHDHYCKTFEDMEKKAFEKVDIPSEEEAFNFGYSHITFTREHSVPRDSTVSSSQSQSPTENMKDITHHFIRKYYMSFDQMLKYNSCFPPSEIPKLFNHQNDDHSIEIQLLLEDKKWIGLALWAYFSVEESLSGKVDKNPESHYPHFLNCYLETNEDSLELSHSYRTTNEEMKWLPRLGGFIWLSYMPCGSFSDHFISFIRASFGSERPGSLVKKCGICPVYDQREFEKIIFHCMGVFWEDPDLMQECLVDYNSVLDTSSSEVTLAYSKSNPSYILLDIDYGYAIKETHSTDKWIENLETFLDKFLNLSLIMELSILRHQISYIPCFNSFFNYKFCFPRKKILEWFQHQTDGHNLRFEIPQNLYDDENWRGFMICTAFSVHEHPAAAVHEVLYSDSEKEVHLMCDFYLGQNKCEIPGAIFRISKEIFKWLLLRGFIWLTYVPHAEFTDDLNKVSYVEAKIHSFDCPGLVVERCGMRLLYQKDVQEFKQTLINCVTSFFDDLEPIVQFLSVNNKKSPDFDNIGIVPWNQRTDIDELLVIDFRRNSTYNSCFTSIEVLEWFRSCIIQGPTVKLQLPSIKPFFDENWIGLALCAYFSDFDHQHPNSNSTEEECSHRLICHLQTEKSSLEQPHMYRTSNEEFRYLEHEGRFIWLSYIPKGWFSDQLNDCCVIEASFFSDTGRSLSVEKCGIRLLFQHNEDEFKKAISQCMKSSSQYGNRGFEASTSKGSCKTTKLDPHPKTSEGSNPTSVKGKEKL